MIFSSFGTMLFYGSLVYLAYKIAEVVGWVRPAGRTPWTPPGPLGISFLGGMYKLGRDPFEGSVKIAKKYGKVIGIDFAQHHAVLVNDRKLVQEVWNHPELLGRPIYMKTWRTKFRLIKGCKMGIFQSEKKLHPETVEYVEEALKDVTSEKMEPIIMKEVAKMLKYLHLKEREGRQIPSTELFEPHAANILWSIFAPRKMPWEGVHSSAAKVIDGLFGVRFYPRNTGTGKSWLFFWRKEVPKNKRTYPGLAIPSMLYGRLINLLPRFTGWCDFIQDYEKLQRIADDIVENHKRDRVPEERANEKDFIDHYLDKIDVTRDIQSIFYKEFGDFNLKALLGDIMMSAVDPMAATMCWAIVVTIPHYHDSPMMKRIQKELDTVVYKDEYVTLQHRPKLVYLNAFLLEVQRYRPVIPWSLPKRTTEKETKIGKFKLPQNTFVIINNYALSKDPTVYPDPEEFRPERFLSEDGLELRPIENFLPLSDGGELTVGCQLFQDELFLMIANIFNRFLIFPEPGPTIPPMDPMRRFIMTPQPFKFTLVQRYPYGR